MKSPVEYFQTGDIVRQIKNSNHVVVLGPYGFSPWKGHEFYYYGQDGARTLKGFNSDEFERVKL